MEDTIRPFLILLLFLLGLSPLLADAGGGLAALSEAANLSDILKAWMPHAYMLGKTSLITYEATMRPSYHAEAPRLVTHEQCYMSVSWEDPASCPITGFVFSDHDGCFHSHAWILACIDGSWAQFDPTMGLNISELRYVPQPVSNAYDLQSITISDAR